MTTALVTGTDLTVAAKNIRTELRAAFPSVKFSVRTSRFAGGDSINIGWTDGPTGKQVEAITDKYKDGDFDGMTDSYNYASREWTSKHGGAKYISNQRQNSDAALQTVIGLLVAEYGPHNVPTVENFHKGEAWNTTPLGGDPVMCHWSWQSLINRKFSETAF